MPNARGHKERIEKLIAEVKGAKSVYGIDSWEWDRLHEWRFRPELSKKQAEILERIERKVFSDDEGDNDEEDFV